MMYNRLSEIIKKVKGNVLVIGLDDALLDKFKSNNIINLYSISSPKNSGIKTNSKKKIDNNGKPINIKRLRKYINKKSVDFLILNMEEVFKYYKYVIKDTIYFNNNIIYIYSTNDIDKEFIINKYKRYKVKITSVDYKNGYIITIDNTEGKNNYIKDKIYFIKDSLFNIAEFIGNLLVS